MDYQMIHSCIRVKDLAASEEFYRKALGFEVSRKLDFPEHKFTLSYLSGAASPFELELTYNYDRSEPYQIGDGYSHLAVAVADLGRSRVRPGGSGHHSSPSTRIRAEGQGRIAFLQRPYGYLGQGERRRLWSPLLE